MSDLQIIRIDARNAAIRASLWEQDLRNAHDGRPSGQLGRTGVTRAARRGQQPNRIYTTPGSGRPLSTMEER